MKKSVILMILLISLSPAFGQGFIKKAKEKVNAGSKLLRDIKGNEAKDTKETDSQNEEYSEEGNSRNGKPSNSKGKKLSNNSIDVASEIANAETNLSGKDYGKTRNSIQQAMLGIEVAMAYKVLESLPTEVLALEADKTTDHVAASGAGYSGLTVTREYYGESTDDGNYELGDEDEGQQYMQFTLVNSSVYSAGINNYIANPVYSSDEDGDKKIVQYKGISSLLEYNEYDGYKLSVPVGQQTLIEFSCVNFEDENEVLKAAESFDIEKIKTYLGEK